MRCSITPLPTPETDELSAARPPPGLRGLGLPIEPVTGFAHSAGLLSSPRKLRSIRQVIEKRNGKGMEPNGHFREIRDITDFRVFLMQQPQQPTKARNENCRGTQRRLKWNEEKSWNGIFENRDSRNPRTALTEFVPILADL
jgi:hypothetical protein